jgi:hypothetical protein
MNYHAADGAIRVIPAHTPSIALGDPSLYNMDNAYGDLGKGFNFLIFNNRWDTNFKMWFEEDISLSYETVLTV